jgi:hypothetical protein
MISESHSEQGHAAFRRSPFVPRRPGISEKKKVLQKVYFKYGARKVNFGEMLIT